MIGVVSVSGVASAIAAALGAGTASGVATFHVAPPAGEIRAHSEAAPVGLAGVARAAVLAGVLPVSEDRGAAFQVEAAAFQVEAEEAAAG